MNAFGTPNAATSLELCGWGRGFATRYTYGVGSVGTGTGGAMPDIANTGCLILWGYNPSMSRLTHATAIIGLAADRHSYGDTAEMERYPPRRHAEKRGFTGF
jgi:anaerobic selenocysteine-containing dehydrogenase